ncbi:DUF6339 family protein [Streptomyces sp. NPDC087422]|uniref:DUF6339 family protein n=1 Tax=Streptomyces sp. NPDC087422 TaxID=3365786 RepID=UPI0037F56B51
MSNPHIDTVDRLGLLSADAAANYLTDGIRAGRQRPPTMAIQRASLPLEDRSARWEAAPIREIVDEAVRRFNASQTAADAWLAPRLHATLRMTRAEAARPEIWNFLALAVAPDYVVWRHLDAGNTAGGSSGKVDSTRFIGPDHRQAFSRLWWAAEMFRDGPDYRLAEVACADEKLLELLLGLDVVGHKPTALAIARIVHRLIESSVSRTDELGLALTSAVNIAGSTLMYEALAPDDLPLQDALIEWIDQADAAPAVPWDRLPDGPDDGAARRTSIDTLTTMFERFIA